MWEINVGNFDFIQQLADTEQLTAVSVAVVVDLSRPQHLLFTCLSLMEFQRALAAQQSRVRVTYALVGMKYDLFEVGKRSFSALKPH